MLLYYMVLVILVVNQDEQCLGRQTINGFLSGKLTSKQLFLQGMVLTS